MAEASTFASDGWHPIGHGLAEGQRAHVCIKVRVNAQESLCRDARSP